jgi:hypothetical protein
VTPARRLPCVRVFDPLTIAISIAYYNLLVNIWPRRPQTVRDLKVWQKSMDLVEVCYRFRQRQRLRNGSDLFRRFGEL